MSPSDAAVLLGLPIGADPERRYTAYMAERKRFEDKLAAAKGLTNQQDRYRQHIAKLDEAYQVMETAFPGPPVSTTRFDKKKTAGNLQPAARAGSSAAIPAKERGATATNLGTNRITRPTQPQLPGEKPPTTALAGDKTAEKGATAPGAVDKIAEKATDRPPAPDLAAVAPLAPAPAQPAPPMPAPSIPLNLPPLPTGVASDPLPELPPAPPPLAFSTGRITNSQKMVVVPEGMVMVPAALLQQQPPGTRSIRRPATSVFVRSDGAAQSLPPEAPEPATPTPGPSALEPRSAPTQPPLETEFDRPTRITFQRGAPVTPNPLAATTPATNAFTRVDAESPSAPAHILSPSTMELQRARAAWQNGERMALPDLTAETGAAAALRADPGGPVTLPSLAGVGSPAAAAAAEASANAKAAPAPAASPGYIYVNANTPPPVKGWRGFFTKEGAPSGMMWCGIDLLLVEIPMTLKLMISGFGVDSPILAICAVLSLPFGAALLFQQEWAAWPARVLIGLQVFRSLRWCVLLMIVGSGLLASAHLFAAAILATAAVMLSRGTEPVTAPPWLYGQAAGALCFLCMMLGAMGTDNSGHHTVTNGAEVKIEHGRATDTVNCFAFTPPPGWTLQRGDHGLIAIPPHDIDAGTNIEINLVWSNAVGVMGVIESWGLVHLFRIRGQEETFASPAGILMAYIAVERDDRFFKVYVIAGVTPGTWYILVGSNPPQYGGKYDEDYRNAAYSLTPLAGNPPRFEAMSDE
jgi:hypothetical protein